MVRKVHLVQYQLTIKYADYLLPLIKVIAYSTENWREKHAACGPDIDGPDFIWKIIEEKEKNI